MDASDLPQRLTAVPGPATRTPQSGRGQLLRSTRALVLVRDPMQSHRLLGRLSSLGVEALEASCASGAAAILRRDELCKRPIDFLFVDGNFGGICGMSLCAALCVQLHERPVVLLAAPLDTTCDSAALTRSGISAVIEPDSSREDLRRLLTGLCKVAGRVSL